MNAMLSIFSHRRLGACQLHVGNKPSVICTARSSAAQNAVYVTLSAGAAHHIDSINTKFCKYYIT